MDNNYQDKLEEHIRNMTNFMFTFEVTKCCGYSTFITIYTHKTLLDLYLEIIDHFGSSEIRELFFYAPSGERVKIPISKTIVSDFVRANVVCNPVKLEPIYPLPYPVIYRLYLDEGCCDSCHCTNNNHLNQNIIT